MRIHLIGVGGISMRALALYLKMSGHDVSGCDLDAVKVGDIPTQVGHDRAHVANVEQVIISSAVTTRSAGWPEVAAALEMKIPVIKRAEAIGEITKTRETITVSGMHGKSTTTGMIAFIFQRASRDPLVMVGAPIREFNGETFRWGNGSFILEADEFDRSFLSFKPALAILTTIEPEHLDYYSGGLPEIIDTFGEFLARIPSGGSCVVYGDDPNIKTVLETARLDERGVRLVTYGEAEGNDYRIVDRYLAEGVNRFSIKTKDGLLGTISLKVPGVHNERNAVAALVAAVLAGIPASEAISSLDQFSGVGRRFELLANNNGKMVISDYAHHPTEVRATIEGARAWAPSKRIFVVFQPHQHSRTKLLFDDFARALSLADKVIVTDIFAVAGREEGINVRASDLAEEVKTMSGDSGKYVPEGQLVLETVNEARSGDLIIAMGAGKNIGLAACQIASAI